MNNLKSRNARRRIRQKAQRREEHKRLHIIRTAKKFRLEIEREEAAKAKQFKDALMAM